MRRHIVGGTAPTVRRRRLLRQLRQLREAAGLTTDQAGERLEVSGTTIWRRETDKNAKLRAIDVENMCRAYGADAAMTTALVALAKGAQARGWWEKYGGAPAQWFETYMGLEDDASDIGTYECVVIPGLLQTEAYAREVTRGTLVLDSTAEIEHRVQIRMARQKVLDGHTALRLWAVIDEAALNRTVGGTAVMREQFSHLVTAAERANCTIQILPYSAGSHAAMVGGPFVLLGFSDRIDPDVVYLENQTGALYLEDEDEVTRYAAVLNHLRATALSADESIAFLSETIKKQ
jgi:transcriptional regulator with XRE-family HTH domain